MFYFNAKLALLALIPFPFLIVGALTYTLTAHRRYRLQRRAASAMNALLHDNLSGSGEIKSFGGEKEEHAGFNRVSDQLGHATLVVMRVWALYSPSMSMFEAIGAVIVLAFGSYSVLSGAMQLGDLVAFLMLTAFLYDPISRLHQLNQLVQAGRAAGERVFEILDEPTEPGWVDNYTPVRVAGDIRYENVNFGYAEGLPALKNILLHAHPGETIALVGATGAGKSTVVSLLPRFYELKEGDGHIYVDGKEIREYGVRALRENIGLVTQESFLFNGSIRENLLMGKPSATDAELWRAVGAANAREFMQGRPAKLEREVGAGGAEIKRGGKQRVSIARAVANASPNLILGVTCAHIRSDTLQVLPDRAR